MVILDGIGADIVLLISVIEFLSSSSVTLRFVMCGFNPLSKLRMHAIAFPMVSMMSRIVMIAFGPVSPRSPYQISNKKLTKSRQTLSSGFIGLVVVGIPHPHKLEDEVRQRSVEDNHNPPHGISHFTPSAPSCAEQEGDCDRERGDGDVKFVVLFRGEDAVFQVICYNDDELDAEAHEEEEIEFQQGDENLPGLR